MEPIWCWIANERERFQNLDFPADINVSGDRLMDLDFVQMSELYEKFV
jgi:hypothetical protein